MKIHAIILTCLISNFAFADAPKKLLSNKVLGLMQTKQNYKCTSETQGKIAGSIMKRSYVYYISDQKIRVESTTVFPPHATSTDGVMSDGKNGYVWENESRQGRKFDPSKHLVERYENITDNKMPREATKTPMEVTCDSWNPDAALFESPAGIEWVGS